MTGLIATLIGTGVSILGAVVAIYQAIRAKRYAMNARKLLQNVNQHRHFEELTELQGRLRRLNDSISNKLFRGDEALQRGINYLALYEDIRKFNSLVKEHRDLFENQSLNAAEAFAKKVNGLLGQATNSDSSAARDVFLRDIAVALDDFAPRIREIAAIKRDMLLG